MGQTSPKALKSSSHLPELKKSSNKPEYTQSLLQPVELSSVGSPASRCATSDSKHRPGRFAQRKTEERS